MKISFLVIFKNENYKIYNILGEILLSGNIAVDEKINVEHLENGSYILTLENGNSIRFVKE